MVGTITIAKVIDRTFENLTIWKSDLEKVRILNVFRILNGRIADPQRNFSIYSIKISIILVDYKFFIVKLIILFFFPFQPWWCDTLINVV